MPLWPLIDVVIVLALCEHWRAAARHLPKFAIAAMACLCWYHCGSCSTLSLPKFSHSHNREGFLLGEATGRTES